MGQKNRQSLLVVLICLLGALMIWNFFGGLINGSASKEIRYDEFKTMVEEGKVEQVEVESGIVNIILKDEKRVTYSTPLIGSEDKLVEFLEENDVKYDKITTGSHRFDPVNDLKHSDSLCSFDRGNESDYAPDEQGRRHDGRGKEQGEGLRSERNRCYI